MKQNSLERLADKDKINVLYDIPKGWVWARLGDVCLEPQYGWTTSANAEGELHLLRTTDITSGKVDWDSVPFCKEEPSEKEKYLLKDGDIVISRAGSVGYSHLIKNPRKAIFASYLIRFKSLIDEQYLAYFLKSLSYWESITEKSIGIALPNVNATKLKQIPIPLPPLPEQHCIVAKIEELFTRLDAGVEALKKIKAQLKRYRQAVLKYAFEGKLTEEWREEHKWEIEPADMLLERIKQERSLRGAERRGKFKKNKDEIALPRPDVGPRNDSLPELPEGWVWVNLIVCSELITKGESPKWQGFNYVNDGIPFIRSENVLWGKLNMTNVAKIPEEFHEKLKRSHVKSNDVLINLVGASIGRPAIVPSNIEIANINQAVALIRTNNSFIPTFLMYLLLSPQIQKTIHDSKVETARPNISLEDLRQLIIPLPPLPEQHKIVEEIERRFSVADEIEKTVDQSLKQAERLRQSILKKAFEGKLVPQDPSDEPAERLLERIKAERAKLEYNKKNRKKRKKPIEELINERI